MTPKAKKSVRFLLLTGVLISLGVVAYKSGEHLWRNKAREFKENPLKALDYLPEAALKVKDFHRVKVNGARKVWEIRGEEARYLKAEKEVVIKKPRFVFHNRDGKTVEANGDEAHLFLTDQDMEKMEIKGDVRVHYERYVLRTEKMVYLKDKNRVVSPGKVTLKGKGMDLEGVGMEIALDNERMKLHQKVKTKLVPEALKTLKMQAGESRENNG